MRPSRRVRLRALLAIVVAMLGSVSLSGADEFLDEFRASINLLPDPTIRSPRLLGMGRLTLVVDEANNRLSLWDFAKMPAGLGDADSISVLELRQTTAAASTLHDILGLGSERQSFAARDVLIGVDGWRRAAGETTFGLTGDFSLLRTDEPFAQTIEARNEFSRPTLVPAVNGPMPYILSDRMRYGLRGIYAIENRREEYRAFVTNDFGEYADQNGLLLNAPDQFSPIETEVSTTGFGGSARYDFGQWLQAGLGFDATKARIRSQNTGLRHGTFYEEDRPKVLGQAVLHGAGPHFEWIADGRTWSSTSEPSWRYTASAGQGSNPLSGRGKLLERDETGSLVRSRARLFSGDFELGGSFSVGTRTIEITPPDPSDRSSFNYFRNITYLRLNADSIALPDSITADEVERRSMEAGFGASWRSPWRGALVGVEYHMAESEDERLSGTGPKRVFWDVRTGVELPLVAEALIGRAGFIYRTDDLDDLTEGNEFVSNAVTLGLGVRPAGRTWTFESGYAYEWFRGDYPDPTQTRGTRNQFNMQVRWDL